MRKKILFSLVIAYMAFNLCSCGKNDSVSDSISTENNNVSDLILTEIKEDKNGEEAEVIEEPEDLIPSSWEYYKENTAIPTPDSCVKDIIPKEVSDDDYIYDLGNDSNEADLKFKAYGAALLGCGFTIEEENKLYLILDDSKETVAAMGTGKEGDSYFLVIYVW